jgi:anti-sigma regulatory factor (Ser/Thr protein kinase)
VTAISLDLNLPPDRHAPGAARHALAGLDPYVAPGLRETLSLLVSELVTNSVLHAGLTPDDCINVHLRADRHGVRVEVRDPGTGFVSAVAADRGTRRRLGGWGLMLVDRLADRWGTETVGPTRVWFELVNGATS